MSTTKRTFPSDASVTGRTRPSRRSGPSRGARPALRRNDDAGFSLVEVLISLTLFTIVAVSSSVALITSAKYTESSENRVIAAGLAAAQISLARGTVDQNTLLPATTTTVQNGATFTIKRDVTLTCATDHKRRITIKVTWGGIGAPVYSDTVRGC